MGVRSALASTLTRAATALGPREPVAKVSGGSEPPGMAQAAEDVSQMTMGSPFAPGLPIGPYDGYDRTPRGHNFVTGYNIATRPRTHERVSFDVLRGLIDNYDVASICIWHKIDTLRGVKWKLLAADGYNGDVSGAVELGMKVMRRPDGINGWRAWFGKWYYDLLAYDAAPLYRMRNRAGNVIGLLPFDGTSLAPLLDYWGNPPSNPGAPPDEQPPAYVQYVNGLPWNWLTRADIIYEPFRAVNSSIYGKAPIESIVLNANTDIRFQLYFLQSFTDGNIPAAFASAPEGWGKTEIDQWQSYWDDIMYGDVSRKSQVKWIPGGSKFAWSNEKEFTDKFSLFMMRKSCACYHVVPTDLGFTETSNYSSGESQADVQHKAGELPPMEYAEEIFSRFLYDDLRLPVKFEFDRGEDQDDRLVQAQADDIYIKNATVGVSEIREMRFGLTEPHGQVVPRFIYTTRAGPIPLASLYGVAGKIDPETAAPDPGTPLPHEAFTTAPGVLPNPPLAEEPLAEQEFGPSAIPPAPPKQAQAVPVATDPARLVAKEGEGAASGATTGITSETGITSYDLIGQDDDEDGPDQVAVAKAELAAFARFRRARLRAGQWRDFEFRAVAGVTGHNLNDGGRLAVRKAAGEIAVAGLAVQAADTGRVLMLQRALCDDDPAAGKLEFPGGHLEGDEAPFAAAAREWQEETGALLSLNPEAMAALASGQGRSWTSGNGVYQGFVYPVPSEASVPVRSGTAVTNPDDPDSDAVEAILWIEPAQLPSNPMLRPELAADLDAVMAALGSTAAGDGPAQGGESVCPCGLPAVWGLDGGDWWSHADGSISHDDGESVSDKMGAVVKSYLDGQTYASHAYLSSGEPAPTCCWYCGMAPTDPGHAGFAARSGVACYCCRAAGEHATGHECYRCDASGATEGSETGSPYCDPWIRDPALHAQGCHCTGNAPVAKAGDGGVPKALTAASGRAGSATSS